TTLERSVKRLGPEEDIMPNEALFGMSLNTIQKSQKQHNIQTDIKANNQLPQRQSSAFGILNSTEPEERYKAYEGGLLIIGGQYGLVEYTVIPLAALMLNNPPIKFSSAIDVLKIGMQTKEQKLENSIHEFFTFPPESQIMDLGRSAVQISEDNKFVIVKGERTYAVRFDPYIGRTIWHSLFVEGGIRNIVPISALVNETIKKRTQKIVQMIVIEMEFHFLISVLITLQKNILRFIQIISPQILFVVIQILLIHLVTVQIQTSLFLFHQDIQNQRLIYI
ncbi:MAG: hypothetical protein EZS28_030170, partial [Streblomastix strix]